MGKHKKKKKKNWGKIKQETTLINFFYISSHKHFLVSPFLYPHSWPNCIYPLFIHIILSNSQPLLKKKKDMEGERITLCNSSEWKKSVDTISILVVDDDTTCLSIVAAILKKFKYEGIGYMHETCIFFSYSFLTNSCSIIFFFFSCSRSCMQALSFFVVQPFSFWGIIHSLLWILMLFFFRVTKEFIEEEPQLAHKKKKKNKNKNHV